MMFEKEGRPLFLEDFERLTQAKWITTLQFEDYPQILKQSEKLYLKGEMSPEQLWLGKYFKEELLKPVVPNVQVRWIDPIIGWGVFALKNFRKMEFIAEYTGIVRKRRKADEKNAYCFEYLLASGVRSPYTIDALDQGGISRYLNHSPKANLASALATLNGMSHIIFYTKEPIAKGAQLCYDYGPDYWAKRAAPLVL